MRARESERSKAEKPVEGRDAWLVTAGGNGTSVLSPYELLEQNRLFKILEEHVSCVYHSGLPRV